MVSDIKWKINLESTRLNLYKLVESFLKEGYYFESKTIS